MKKIILGVITMLVFSSVAVYAEGGKKTPKKHVTKKECTKSTCNMTSCNKATCPDMPGCICH